MVARPGLSASAQLGAPGQLERRLRRELQNQGLVDDSDGPSAVADDQVSSRRRRPNGVLSPVREGSGESCDFGFDRTAADLQLLTNDGTIAV